MTCLEDDSVPRTRRVFIGVVVRVQKADLRLCILLCDSSAMCHVLFFQRSTFNVQRSALERVIVERGSSRRIYDEPTG
jgi:hypothetical protein